MNRYEIRFILDSSISTEKFTKLSSDITRVSRDLLPLCLLCRWSPNFFFINLYLLSYSFHPIPARETCAIRPICNYYIATLLHTRAFYFRFINNDRSHSADDVCFANNGSSRFADDVCFANNGRSRSADDVCFANNGRSRSAEDICFANNGRSHSADSYCLKIYSKCANNLRERTAEKMKSPAVRIVSNSRRNKMSRRRSPMLDIPQIFTSYSKGASTYLH